MDISELLNSARKVYVNGVSKISACGMFYQLDCPDLVYPTAATFYLVIIQNLLGEHGFLIFPKNANNRRKHCNQVTVEFKMRKDVINSEKVYQ